MLAVSAAGGAAAHVGVAVLEAHATAVAAVFIVMALLCLPCSVHLWRGNRSALGFVAANAVGMVLIHVAMAAGVAGGHHHGHGTFAALTLFECGIATGAWCTARLLRPLRRTT